MVSEGGWSLDKQDLAVDSPVSESEREHPRVALQLVMTSVNPLVGGSTQWPKRNPGSLGLAETARRAYAAR
jgi:hypothetical protein